MRKFLYIIFAGATVMAIASCANDVWHQNGDSAGEGGLIEFTATTTTAVDVTRGGMDPLKVTGYKKQLWLIPTVEDAAKDATRGIQLTSTSILQNFGVSAYLHGKTEDITEKRPDFFYNKEAVRDATTGKYSFDQDYYWPSSNEYLSFMAYAPYGSTLATLADIGASEPAKGAQKISFTVAEDVANQVDLMTATAMQQTPSTTSTPNVNLQFEHQLAGIRFVVGDQFPTKGYIQKITLKNVYASGIYTLSDGATPGSWSYGDRYNYVAGTADQELTGEVGQAITTETQTFLMLPCTFANNDVAAVEIDYWDGYAKHTVTASLAGVTWEAGKTYTYELSSQNLTKLKVQSIAFAPTISDAPHSKWQTGDKVGLYVVQGKDAQGAADGHTLRYKNIPVTCTVSMVGSNEVVTWAVDHTTAQGNVYKYPGDSYYFYYPYKEGTPDGYPNECNEVNATASTFFSSVINSHTPFIDQSGVGAAEGNFEKSDLQVARAVVPEDANSQLPASTIKGSLARQVGLAVIEMPGVSILTDSIMLNNAKVANQPRTVVKASSNFSGNKPRQSGEKYYYFVKPSTSNTIFNSATGLTDSWLSSVDVSLGAGETGYYKAYSKRAAWTYINSIVWRYNYSGNMKTFQAPLNGSYVMECWGANGGASPTSVIAGNTNAWPGIGGYTKGTISLTKNNMFYIYVGGVGNRSKTALGTENTGGWNGGGISGAHETVSGASGGGGATDIRIVAASTTTLTTWNVTSSLRTRIMVAGGGGGCGNRRSPNMSTHADCEIGGCGGGLIGETGGSLDTGYGDQGWLTPGGGQNTSVGSVARHESAISAEAYWHGVGGFGYASQTSNKTPYTGMPQGFNCHGSGAGGGWYGGVKGWGTGGGGGSSFISGHPGCNAVNTSTGAHLGASTKITYNSVTYTFTDTEMIDGDGYKWTSATQTRTYSNRSNPGVPSGASKVGVPTKPESINDGYCRITYTRQ